LLLTVQLVSVPGCGTDFNLTQELLSHDMLDSLKKISVVLVAPQGGLNLGSVARCMANFGFSDLRLVTPEADPNGDDARRMAVRAVGLLEQATHFPDLASALADCHLALGTTRRFGKYREDFMNPDEIGPFVAPALAAGRIALVFGREDKGLFTEELDLCQRFITIPTDDALPSMNLSHAVGLCLYETCQGLRVASGQSGRKRLASGATLDGLYAHMRQSLQEIDFLDEQNPDHILHAFRRIFGRALLNDREVRILRGLLSRIDWLEQDRRKKSPGGQDA